MKRILVTGSNGLLGQKLTDLILSSGRARLCATSLGNNRFPVTGGYDYRAMDITDSDQIAQVVNWFKPDVIINTAAMTNVDTCHMNHELCRRVNVTAVRNLVELCGQQSIHLIHLSTDFVFNGLSGPYSEDDSPDPISFYGESKRDAEDLVRSSHCRWTIIRTILVYGLAAQMSRSNIVLWAKGALENGTVIKVVNDQYRMPTLAEDLAEACLKAAEKGAEGMYHVSGKNMMSVLELVEKVADFWKLDKMLIVPVSSASLNQEARRPLKTGFILDKAGSELDYKPHSFEEGLQILDSQLSAML